MAGDHPSPGDFCLASIWHDYGVNTERDEEKTAAVILQFEAFPKVLEMIKSLREKRLSMII